MSYKSFECQIKFKLFAMAHENMIVILLTSQARVFRTGTSDE